MLLDGDRGDAAGVPAGVGAEVRDDLLQVTGVYQHVQQSRALDGSSEVEAAQSLGQRRGERDGFRGGLQPARVECAHGQDLAMQQIKASCAAGNRVDGLALQLGVPVDQFGGGGVPVAFGGHVGLPDQPCRVTPGSDEG
ncbi:hypothetical protein [Actinoplanes regularis]|uniref:hypothetical protein n=1 Tax=Actinoplanes regularis TaxID=52697 RepID=UPI0024A232E7|nr:hypothetical protein [Actinoplanes regularis]GLW29303.1 hypothetical protein Areg01_22430 [Actinoplanes regularis]